MFSLASPDGYLHHAELYCRADTQLSETSFGLGGNIILFSSQVCYVPVGSRLHFDNWFTSIPLVDRLKVDGIGGRQELYQRTGMKKLLSYQKQSLKSRKEGQCPMHAMEAT